VTDHAPTPLATATAAPGGDVGLVTPQDFVCREPFTFDNGATIPEFTLRYETYGKLDPARANAIYICHALSGDHHCAGRHHPEDRKPGWWDNIIGPGKPLDTTRYFVICANCLGGCRGSTGPASINPKTGRPYNLDFPALTIRDMVRAQARLLDHLGVTSLAAVVGGSMGGMQALQWAIDFPQRVRGVIALATTARQSAQAIAFNAVGRNAIMHDAAWNNGNYDPDKGPNVGLAVARMMAHITYLSDKSMDTKFGRARMANSSGDTPPPLSTDDHPTPSGDRQPTPSGEPSEPSATFAKENSPSATLAKEGSPSVASAKEGAPNKHHLDAEFEVESYLRYQGQSFVNRFDANTYLYFTKALDRFDLHGPDGRLEDAFRPMAARALVVGFLSDWLFPPRQNQEIAQAMLRAGKPATYAEVSSDLGHDSFLLNSPDLYALLRAFLAAENYHPMDIHSII
jgi:homoserine O-acetyltransferase